MRPSLTTAQQAGDDLGVADAERRISEWVKANQLEQVGTYYPPGGKAQPLYRTTRVLKLAESKDDGDTTGDVLATATQGA